jgi:thymidylate synthase ThyX
MDIIQAKVIRDSLYHSRLTTLEVTYPSYIHAEVMTHRVFSRNFQSRRAIPVEKLIQKVRESNWYPMFMKNKPGMAATETMSGKDLDDAKAVWDLSREQACDNAARLAFIGCHKQIANRVLEPFSTITGIITATEWDNFFSLRIHPAAQQEMRVLAEKMKEALDSSKPTQLDVSHWHTPFISHDEEELPLDLRLKLSTARTARVSYLTHDGQRDIDKDIILHDSLRADRHMSPFEHVATPSISTGFSGNFRGWLQYRKYVEQGTY